jgi:hypothetical protein
MVLLPVAVLINMVMGHQLQLTPNNLDNQHILLPSSHLHSMEHMATVYRVTVIMPAVTTQHRLQLLLVMVLRQQVLEVQLHQRQNQHTISHQLDQWLTQWPLTLHK